MSCEIEEQLQKKLQKRKWKKQEGPYKTKWEEIARDPFELDESKMKKLEKSLNKLRKEVKQLRDEKSMLIEEIEKERKDREELYLQDEDSDPCVRRDALLCFMRHIDNYLKEKRKMSEREIYKMSEEELLALIPVPDNKLTLSESEKLLCAEIYILEVIIRDTASHRRTLCELLVKECSPIKLLKMQRDDRIKLIRELSYSSPTPDDWLDDMLYESVLNVAFKRLGAWISYSNQRDTLTDETQLGWKEDIDQEIAAAYAEDMQGVENVMTRLDEYLGIYRQ